MKVLRQWLSSTLPAVKPLARPSKGLWPATRWVVARLFSNIGHHNLTVEAAGIAFYGMLAAFPALATIISLYALWADPSDALGQFAVLRRVMPGPAWELLNHQLLLLVTQPHESLGLGALVALVIALWSSGAGVRALITALNIVYMERETRGLLRFYLVAAGFTAGVTCLAIVSLTTIVVTPVVLKVIYLGTWSETLISLSRWPIILAFLGTVLVLFYKYGASRTPPKIIWTLPGVAFASVGWLIASYLFSAYVSSFADYNKTYGTLGGVVILQTWFYISAFLVLLGAELNAALEYLATDDTTEGPPAPPGARGARVADNDPEHDFAPEPTPAEAAGVDP